MDKKFDIGIIGLGPNTSFKKSDLRLTCSEKECINYLAEQERKNFTQELKDNQKVRENETFTGKDMEDFAEWIIKKAQEDQLYLLTSKKYLFNQYKIERRK